MWRAGLIGMVAFLGAEEAHAQGSPAIPVAVVIKSENEQTGRLALQIRERVRSSPTFRVVDTAATGMRARIAILDITGAGLVAYSLTVTFKPEGEAELFLGDNVGICAYAKFRDCAETAVASLSEQSEEFMSELRSAVRNAPDATPPILAPPAHK